MDFDALMVQRQGFNTLDTLANSAVTQTMSQQTLQSVQTMQTPMPQGHIPQHVVLPIFQKQAEQQQQQQAAASAAPALQFFVIINGQQRGPVSLEQLKGLAICEVIDENSQVWLQGTPNWTDLKTCLSQLK